MFLLKVISIKTNGNQGTARLVTNDILAWLNVVLTQL